MKNTFHVNTAEQINLVLVTSRRLYRKTNPEI